MRKRAQYQVWAVSNHESNARHDPHRNFPLLVLSKASLLFDPYLNPPPSFSQIIAYLHNFWPYQLFISLAEDGCHSTFVRSSGVPQCPWTAHFVDPLMLPLTCQLALFWRVFLTSQRIEYEFSAFDNSQSFPIATKSSPFYCSWRTRLTPWPGTCFGNQASYSPWRSAKNTRKLTRREDASTYLDITCQISIL